VLVKSLETDFMKTLNVQTKLFDRQNNDQALLNETNVNFHAISGSEVSEGFKVKIYEGLSDEEANQIRKTIGANIIKPKKNAVSGFC
jgi:hypothetical protein